MQSLHSFANHVGSLTAQTVQARTHRFGSRAFGITHPNASAKVSKFLIGNPSLLSTRRRYPHSAFATSVNNSQDPFGFQVQNIDVGNKLGSKGINDFNQINSQNQFGLNPKDVNKSTENDAQNQVAHDLTAISRNPQGVRGKERNQYIRSCGPSVVTARSKGFIHNLSIAGEGK